MIQKTKKVLAITFTAAAVGFALVDSIFQLGHEPERG